MKLHCPLCGEEAMADRIQRDLYSVVCIECGACSVVVVGDQLIAPNSVPGRAA
jgi:ferredoxin-like protein FixX